MSRFDATRLKRSPGLSGYAHPTLYALGALIAVALIFQLFFRYQYLETNGVQWRLDRLTQQMCQVTIGEARCKISLSSAVSTSVSTSITTSTSVSVKKSKSH